MSARKIDLLVEIVEKIRSATDIASRFAEEAYWDLRIAEKLLAGLDLGTCNHNDEVFYTGRRVLYLLQQASEKAAKAHLITYFRMWLEQIEPVINKDSRLRKILVRLNNRLEPRQIGHASHRAIFDLFCGLYELFYKEKSSGYLFSEMLSRYLQVYTKDEIAEWIVELLRKPELPEDLQRSIEQLCEGKGVGGKSPPCLTEEVLGELRSLREDFERMVEEALVKGPTEEQLAEYAKHLLKKFAEALESAGGAKTGTKECLERMATSDVETLVQHAKEFGLGSLYSYYLLAYFFIVYPCLVTYETAGRYPDEEVDVYKDRGRICQDIEKLNLLIEEARLLVDKVKRFVEELKYLVCLEARQPC